MRSETLIVILLAVTLVCGDSALEARWCRALQVMSQHSTALQQHPLAMAVGLIPPSHLVDTADVSAYLEQLLQYLESDAPRASGCIAEGSPVDAERSFFTMVWRMLQKKKDEAVASAMYGNKLGHVRSLIGHVAVDFLQVRWLRCPMLKQKAAGLCMAGNAHLKHIFDCAIDKHRTAGSGPSSFACLHSMESILLYRHGLSTRYDLAGVYQMRPMDLEEKDTIANMEQFLATWSVPSAEYVLGTLRGVLYGDLPALYVARKDVPCWLVLLLTRLLPPSIIRGTFAASLQNIRQHCPADMTPSFDDAAAWSEHEFGLDGVDRWVSQASNHFLLYTVTMDTITLFAHTWLVLVHSSEHPFVDVVLHAEGGLGICRQVLEEAKLLIQFMENRARQNWAAERSKPPLSNEPLSTGEWAVRLFDATLFAAFYNEENPSDGPPTLRDLIDYASDLIDKDDDSTASLSSLPKAFLRSDMLIVEALVLHCEALQRHGAPLPMSDKVRLLLDDAAQMQFGAVTSVLDQTTNSPIWGDVVGMISLGEPWNTAAMMALYSGDVPTAVQYWDEARQQLPNHLSSVCWLQHVDHVHPPPDEADQYKDAPSCRVGYAERADLSALALAKPWLDDFRWVSDAWSDGNVQPSLLESVLEDPFTPPPFSVISFEEPSWNRTNAAQLRWLTIYSAASLLLLDQSPFGFAAVLRLAELRESDEKLWSDSPFSLSSFCSRMDHAVSPHVEIFRLWADEGDPKWEGYIEMNSALGWYRAHTHLADIEDDSPIPEAATPAAEEETTNWFTALLVAAHIAPSRASWRVERFKRHSNPKKAGEGLVRGMSFLTHCCGRFLMDVTGENRRDRLLQEGSSSVHFETLTAQPKCLMRLAELASHFGCPPTMRDRVPHPDPYSHPEDMCPVWNPDVGPDLLCASVLYKAAATAAEYWRKYHNPRVLHPDATAEVESAVDLDDEFDAGLVSDGQLTAVITSRFDQHLRHAHALLQSGVRPDAEAGGRGENGAEAGKNGNGQRWPDDCLFFPHDQPIGFSATPLGGMSAYHLPRGTGRWLHHSRLEAELVATAVPWSWSMVGLRMMLEAIGINTQF